MDVAKTLHIDAEPLLRIITSKHLIGLGHEFLEAPDGVEGLALFRLHRPDIVLSGRRVPERVARTAMGIGECLGLGERAQGSAFCGGGAEPAGQGRPIIDIRKRFGLAPRQADKMSRRVVFALGGKVMGCLVDSVSEVLRLPSSMVEAPPASAIHLDSPFIRGVGRLDDQLLILLGSEQVLAVEVLGSQASSGLHKQ